MKQHSYHIAYQTPYRVGDTRINCSLKIKPTDMECIRKHISQDLCDGEHVIITGIFYFGEFEHESEDGA